MKNVDILFLYETRNRELENICLIKSELEKRGFSVAVINTWTNLYIKKPPYNAKVIVTHAMYDNGVYFFVKKYCGKVPKVVNMQCEQIGTVFEEKNPESRMLLKDVAKQCMNICWGNRTYRRLHDIAGIDDKHLSVTGQVAFDFCRKELKGYYLSRKEITEKYKINPDLNINLFISSFSYVNLPENIIKKSDLNSKDDFIKFSVDSFNIVLQWFKKLLDSHKDQAIIYRPHPAEADNPRLKEIKEKYPDRFFVIGDLSVKQWISIADRVYSWYSTSSAEAYMLGVPISVLRPVDVPPDLEVSLFENAKFINNYEGFEKTLYNEGQTSLCKEIFDDLYYVDEKPAYIHFADTIQKVYEDDGYLIKNPPQRKTGFKRKIKKFIYGSLEDVAYRLPKSVHFMDRFKTPPITDEYTLERQRINGADIEEIEKLQKHIEKVIAENS